VPGGLPLACLLPHNEATHDASIGMFARRRPTAAKVILHSPLSIANPENDVPPIIRAGTALLVVVIEIAQLTGLRLQLNPNIAGKPTQKIPPPPPVTISQQNGDLTVRLFKTILVSD
jgi:hypothetical protein